nr:AlpA family phage regulatory protein [Thioalkalivibrio sp. ALgr3]
MRINEVLERTAMARSTWYAMISRGDAPRPVKVGAASRWRESEVDDWIRRQVRGGTVESGVRGN